jgi:ribosomal protein S18 acetylase RimI-like enzyme
MLSIEYVKAAKARRLMPQLMALLRDGVESGASIGFTLPLSDATLQDYWRGVIRGVRLGSQVLLLGWWEDQLAGSVQLSLATKPNALHRAEVQKLMVHTQFRQLGIASQLMHAIEEVALADYRSLLVLDTRLGDPSERLYRKLGYRETGVVPRYALSIHGQLEDCIFMYKELG